MALSAAEPDLGLGGTFQPSFVRTGDRITYSLRVTNSSPAPATGAYMLSETPTNLTFVASSSTQGACAMSGGFVWCDFGSVTDRTNVAVSLTFRADFPGSFSHRFSVSHDELDLYEGDNWLTFSNQVWPPLLYIDRLDIPEGNSGTTTALMNLRLSGGSGQEIQVMYATKDGTAMNGTDYVSTNGTVIFPPFTTNQSIAVPILGDETYEADEFVRMEIHGLINAHLGTVESYALLTIRNDDTGAVFSIWDTSVVEGDQGFTNATFLITLSKPASTPLMISFRTEDGTATLTNDYTEQRLNPVFPAGTTNLTVTVPVRGNTVNEPDEVFRARIGYYTTSASHTFARTQATATIINDDAVAGRLDHFAVGPIASPQHQGVTFPVSITARDYENNPVSYNGTALLSCDTHSGVVARLYDDFEDIRLDGWTNTLLPGFAALIVTNNAAQGTYSLLVSGQSPFNGQGLERRIASISEDIASQPNHLSFYVKARRTNQLSHLSLQYLFYRVFRFGFDINGLMGFWRGGEQQIRGGVPYAADTWYKIGIDLSYERSALDYYVNDTLVLTNVPFLDWSYGNVDQMVIGSGSLAGESWWDDFRLEATNVYLRLPTTLTNITFANGVWNGEVAVGQFATNAILRVNDGFEHVGYSALFNILPPPQLSLSFSPATIETAGQLPATVTSSVVLSNDLLITLTSSDTSEARVPQTVLLPAGQTSAAFTIEILDDNGLDGTQQPLIIASAANFISATNRLLVHDNEVGVLSIPLVAQFTEGMGPAQGRVTVNAPVETNVIVRLTSSDTNQLLVPPEVIVLPGLTSVVFAITVVNDRYIDGTAQVTITAHVENWVDGVATFDVRDNESTNLLLTFTGPFSEGLGLRTNIARLQLSGLPTTNVPVHLVSSDTTELQVPDFVTIPAGQTSLLFQVSFVDDSDFDGAQPVTVTATAGGFAASSTNFLVLDNELHHVAFLPISGAITSGLPFGITLEARDINDRTMVEISGPPVVFTLSATNEGNVPVLLQGNTIYLLSGNARANVTAYSPDAVVRLSASDGANIFAQSDPFQVFAAAFRSFDVPGVHIAYDQVSRKIFAAVGTNGTNRITVIDPHRGLLESFVTLPYPPAKLAVSANGQYLYVALQRTNQVLRLELPSLQSNLLFSLGPSLAWVTDMLVLPGSPGSLLVSHGTISLYDDGVKRPDDATTYSAGLLTFGASDDIVYTSWGGSPAQMSELRILPTGVRLERQLYAGASYYTEKSLRYADGLLYFGIGYVVDPRDGSRIDAISGDFVLPDSQANRISTLYGPGWPNMAAFGFYEQTTRSQIGEMRITNLFGSSHSLLRWGSNGLAFITSGGFSNSTPVAAKVHLLRSPMLVAQPSADLSVRVTADSALGLIDQDVTFTATVSNAGPNVVSNVYVRQSIRWTNVRASRTNYLDRWRDLEFGALSPGQTFTVDFVCRTNLPYALSNVVWAASAAYDPDTINNTAYLTIPVTFQSLPDQVIEWPNLRVKDIAWDRRGKKLYAIDLADQLLALDPVRITSSVALSLGTNAYRLEVAPSGDYLYILQNTSTVRRLDLPGLNNPIQFNVPRQIYHMVIAPDRPALVAFGGEYWIGLYDGGVRLGNTVTNWNCCNLIAFGTNHSRLYAIQYGGTIAHYNAGPFGLAFEDAAGPTYYMAASAGGRFYALDGAIVDAETRLNIGQVNGNTPFRNVLLDPANGILCYYSYPELRVVDATTFASRGVIQQLYTAGSSVQRMVRWGDDGLAFKNDYNRLVLMRTYAVGDHDRDGLTDAWERNYFGSTSALPTQDADGDGMLNLAEFQAGTNPTNAADALRIDNITRDKLRFRTVAGKYYTLERNTTLSTNTWTPSVRNVPGNDGPQDLPILQPGFYRLKLVQ